MQKLPQVGQVAALQPLRNGLLLQQRVPSAALEGNALQGSNPSPSQLRGWGAQAHGFQASVSKLGGSWWNIRFYESPLHYDKTIYLHFNLKEFYLFVPVDVVATEGDQLHCVSWPPHPPPN